MKRLALLLAVFAAATAFAQDKRPMTFDDVMALKNVSGALISPDGKTVVYSLSHLDMKDNETINEIWIVPSAGGTPRKFTSGKNDRSPQWSPNSQSVAFLRGSGESQIHVISANVGESEKLTDSKTSISAFRWSPDSKRIAYVAQVPLTPAEEARQKDKNDAQVADANFRFSSLSVIDVTSKSEKEIAKGDFVASDPQWSPDGKRIAYMSRPTPKADDGKVSDIYIAAADGSSAPRKLYDNAGPDSSPRWSPDGKLIAFNTRPASKGLLGFERLSVISADGGTPRPIAPNHDAEVSNVTWSADGSKVYFQSGVRTTTQIFSVSAQGGTAAQLSSGEAVISGFTMSNDGKIAFTKSDIQHPADVYVASIQTMDPKKLTDHNPQLKDVAMGRGEVVRWKSKDGLDVEGVLVYPVGYTTGKKYPLIANIHGGPSGVWTRSFPNGWTNYAHVWAGKGWVVFMPNVRGSSNYGEKFLLANVRDWGGGDYQDIQSGLDDLVKRGIADPDKMGQAGWSYGGYMTAWTLTQTNRFKAVMVGAGLTNMFSMYSTNDLQRVLEGYFGDTPFNDTEAYKRASAMTFIKQAKTPTLIMQGGADQRVPPSQAQELYMGLKKNGVPAEMVVFPREPHGLGEPRHRLDKMKREYAWFSKYVLGAEEKADARTDREMILDVAQKTFDNLADHDGAKMRTLFWPDATVVGDVIGRDGKREQRFMKAEDWIKSIETSRANIKETMPNPQVSISEGIASVWGKYTLYRDGQSVAEGIDAFHLVRRNGEWKIISLTWAQEK